MHVDSSSPSRGVQATLQGYLTLPYLMHVACLCILSSHPPPSSSSSSSSSSSVSPESVRYMYLRYFVLCTVPKEGNPSTSLDRPLAVPARHIHIHIVYTHIHKLCTTGAGGSCRWRELRSCDFMGGRLERRLGPFPMFAAECGCGCSLQMSLTSYSTA